MKILIGTGNPAKFKRYRTILQQLPEIEVVSLRDVQLNMTIVEDGATAEENARKKATTYAEASGLPTLSIDESLYIQGLPQEEQPGIYVRRYLRKDATDEERLNTFLEKIRPLSQENRRAKWLFAICLALPQRQTFSCQVGMELEFTDEPKLPIRPGYPLSSIFLDPISGKALHDLTPEAEQKRLATLYTEVKRIVKQAVLR